MHPTSFLAILVSLAVLPMPGTAAVSSCADGVEPLAQRTEEYQFDVPIGEFTITRVCPTTAVSCMGENENITHWLFIPNPAANGTYVSTNATTLSLCVLSNGSLLITLPSEGLSEPVNFTVTFIPTDMPETSAELQIFYFPQGFYHNVNFLMTEGEELQDVWRSYGICQDNVTLCELTGNQLAEPSDLFGPLDIGTVDEDECGSQRPPLTYAVLFNREVSCEDSRNYSLVLVERGVCNGSEDQIVSGPVTVHVSVPTTTQPIAASLSRSDGTSLVVGMVVVVVVVVVVAVVIMVSLVYWTGRKSLRRYTYISEETSPVEEGLSVIYTHSSEGVSQRKRKQTHFSDELHPLLRSLLTIISTIQCTSSGAELHSNEHDIHIEIPPGAIPDGETLSIQVGVVSFGPFNFPEGMAPVSPIVWLCITSVPHQSYYIPVS